ncbi:hypothetical protein [Halodurantibacterium flavum]|uniref:Uncharacterized protein n=1 Tax=Halodurantibacterium flavum TaxID=1382802 RepID=A0ABW4S398_9RHOB
MSRQSVLSLFLLLSTGSASAQELSYFQTLYDETSVATQALTIRLAPVDQDIRFSVTLRNNETGFERRHEFDASVPEMPTPFQFEQRRICDIHAILLTVDYPWRHHWPQVARILDTFAFRATDLAFIDVVEGALTDIALLDSSEIAAEDMAMQPSILVECISNESGSPFRFQLKTNN